MFVRRFMESLNIQGMCIGTMNLVIKRPLLHFSPSPQGRGLGSGKGSSACRTFTTQPVASSNQRFMESLVLLRTRIGTLNRFAKLRRSGMFVRRFMESFEGAEITKKARNV